MSYPLPSRIGTTGGFRTDELSQTDGYASDSVGNRQIFSRIGEVGLIYTLLTKGEEYVNRNQTQYEARYRQQGVKTLTKKAEQLGFQLVPVCEAT